MSVLIVLLLILLVFAFVVTKPSGGYRSDVNRLGFEEFRLEGFSKWLRERVESEANWSKIRVCVSESNVCSKLSQDYFAAPEFLAARISPIQVYIFF